MREKELHSIMLIILWGGYSTPERLVAIYIEINIYSSQIMWPPQLPILLIIFPRFIEE